MRELTRVNEGQSERGAKVTEENAGTPHPIRANRRGVMFVLSSPSGAGKSSLSRAILNHDPQIEMSVSVTTRPKRPNEVDGRDYHFVDNAAFDQLLEQNAFIEWAHVFDYRYGTPRAPVAQALQQGRDILFDVDWQGARRLKGENPQDMVGIFILPPSIDELHRRLSSRATDSAAVVAGRMARARDEISHWDEFDYALINDRLDDCLTHLHAIFAAERLRRTRNLAGLGRAVDELLTPERPAQ